MKGFRNKFKVVFQVVNLDRLAELFPNGGEVGPVELAEAGAVRQGPAGQGARHRRARWREAQVSAHAFSASAKEKIAAAGGSATEL